MKRPHYQESVILERADYFLNCAREDQSDLSRFGIDVGYLDALQAKKEYAETLPDWEGQLMELNDETGKKNNALAECVEWGKDFRAKLEIRYGKNSPEYRKFPTSSFNRADSSERRMIRVMQNLLKLARGLQSDMTGFGTTEEFLNQGQSLLDSLRSANNAQEEQKGDSKVTTQERYGIFNGLIEDCNNIRTAGRRVYRDNPSKLARYDVKWAS